MFSSGSHVYHTQTTTEADSSDADSADHIREDAKVEEWCKLQASALIQESVLEQFCVIPHFIFKWTIGNNDLRNDFKLPTVMLNIYSHLN